MEDRPEFTKEQEHWICFAIGEWYLEWHNKIVPDGLTHRLGYAQENLKEILCGKLINEKR